VEELVTAVMQQLDTLRTKGPDQVNVDKVKEIQRKNREVNLKENRFWLSQFRVAYANGENPEELLGFNKLVDNLSAGAIQAAAKKYFDTANMVKVVLFPEKK
jgi:zinc protease